MSRPRIYTRTGDGGETSLLGPTRVSKAHPRVEACGSVDELNAHLGQARAACLALGEPGAQLAATLESVQRRLFALGSALAADPARPGPSPTPGIGDADVEWVEERIDEMEQALAPLRQFILPGGAPAAAALHVARTVARRAERVVVHLAANEPVPAHATAFLNRLSDLLFVMARRANALAGVPDVTWERP